MTSYQVCADSVTQGTDNCIKTCVVSLFVLAKL